ncbi:MAG TPA: hypothetical protein VLM05_10450, partial [Mycobacteriales bacterium]|nr:hypothetical protein [Mycobacteriales bacterium]
AYEQALADAAPAPDAPAVPGDDALLDTEPAADPAAPEPISAGSADPAAAQAAIAEPGVAEPTVVEAVQAEAVQAESAASAPEPGEESGVGPAESAEQPEAGLAGSGGEPGVGLAEVVAEEPVEAVVAEVPADELPADGGDHPGGDHPAGDDEPTETELVAPALGIDEPTATIARPAGDEETGTRIPMPTFSEAPTMEIPAVTDNLRAVRGIGPSMERMLHNLGIISFRQLAMLDGAELERVRTELSDFRTRIDREDWVGQARELHRAKYGRDPV